MGKRIQGWKNAVRILPGGLSDALGARHLTNAVGRLLPAVSPSAATSDAKGSAFFRQLGGVGGETAFHEARPRIAHMGGLSMSFSSRDTA